MFGQARGVGRTQRIFTQEQLLSGMGLTNRVHPPVPLTLTVRHPWQLQRCADPGVVWCGALAVAAAYLQDGCGCGVRGQGGHSTSPCQPTSFPTLSFLPSVIPHRCPWWTTCSGRRRPRSLQQLAQQAKGQAVQGGQARAKAWGRPRAGRQLELRMGKTHPPQPQPMQQHQGLHRRCQEEWVAGGQGRGAARQTCSRAAARWGPWGMPAVGRCQARLWSQTPCGAQTPGRRCPRGVSVPAPPLGGARQGRASRGAAAWLMVMALGWGMLQGCPP